MLVRAFHLSMLLAFASFFSASAGEDGGQDTPKQPEPKKEEPALFEGKPGCAKCDHAVETKAGQCAPVLNVKDTRYWLRKADAAGEDTAKKLAACPKKLGDRLAVKGVAAEDKDGRHWIAVSEFVPDPKVETKGMDAKRKEGQEEAKKTGMLGGAPSGGAVREDPLFSYLQPNSKWMDSLLKGFRFQSTWDDWSRAKAGTNAKEPVKPYGLLDAAECTQAPSCGPAHGGPSAQDQAR
ncbi:MAG: hypothetical protein L6R28_12430 [Planctomycetes bacterium]|nr:hypothetical protein [Planctomycetota bacterium]